MCNFNQRKALESFVWLEVKDSCYKISILKAHFSGKSKVLIWWMKIIKIGYHYLTISRTIYDTLKAHIIMVFLGITRHENDFFKYSFTDCDFES